MLCFPNLFFTDSLFEIWNRIFNFFSFIFVTGMWHGVGIKLPAVPSTTKPKTSESQQTATNKEGEFSTNDDDKDHPTIF